LRENALDEPAMPPHGFREEDKKQEKLYPIGFFGCENARKALRFFTYQFFVY
jgi:hypothetical protein